MLHGERETIYVSKLLKEYEARQSVHLKSEDDNYRSPSRLRRKKSPLGSFSLGIGS
jgi:hypothetical protein